MSRTLIIQPGDLVPHDIEAPRTHQGLRPVPFCRTLTHDEYLSAVMVPWLLRIGPVHRPVVAKLWFHQSLPWPGVIGDHWLHQLRQLGHRSQYGIGDALEIFDDGWIAKVDTRALFDASRGAGERLHLPAERIAR